MTLINTKGMTFVGPGSEWFWAALQFTALAITFIAIYRQVRIAQSGRAVEQVTAYTREFEEERMYRYQLAILVALRDGVAIPDAAGSNVSNYFETLGLLSRRGHLDIKLLWGLFTQVTVTWWVVLEQFVRRARAEGGDAIFQDFEWLVGVMRKMDRQQGRLVTVDRAWVAQWLAAGAIQRLEETLRVEQSLRRVIVAPADGSDDAPVAAAAPARAAATEPTTDPQQVEHSESARSSAGGHDRGGRTGLTGLADVRSSRQDQATGGGGPGGGVGGGSPGGGTGGGVPPVQR